MFAVREMGLNRFYRRSTGIMNKYAECEINFTDETKENLRVLIDGAAETAGGVSVSLRQETDGGCELISIVLRPDNESGGKMKSLRAEKPLRLLIPFEKHPEALTAMYMLNPWWTRPAFVKGYEEIPELTRIVFARFKDCFACLFPMAGQQFMTMMGPGRETEILLEMSAGTESGCQVDEPVFLYAEGRSVDEAVHKVFVCLESRMNLLPAKERMIPEMLRYLGWCSWDAFYRDVNEEGIRAKAAELHEKNIPVRWMLVDDGWQQVTDRTMDAYEPDRSKFPDGFKKMTDDIRKQTEVRWFGVWHALFGYWDGITPGSSLPEKISENLIHSAAGGILPDPENAEGFYRRWYEQLKDDGINFTKVDGQSSLADLYKNTVPVMEAARGVSAGLEKAASVFGGAVINCMGMAMENILARPSLAVSRNSDDFVPSRENGFAEHLLQNAYNSLYHNELYCCDWDMFWTKHPDAVRHALIRAVSGGPVYFSDRVGESDHAVLKSLCYPDGELLMMSRSAKPAADCIFTDPFRSGVLKLQNAGISGGRMAGGIAAFNLTAQTQAFSFSPDDIPELTGSGKYIAYDYFTGKLLRPQTEKTFCSQLPAGGYAWYVFIAEEEVTCLGLTDKFTGFLAVEDAFRIGPKTDFILHGCGSIGIVSEKEIQSAVLNGRNVTDMLERNGTLYSVRLPEKEGRTILSVTV